MEAKDWITLLIPIVFNGIIAVIFGKYYENKWEIKKYKEGKKQKIEDKFYDLLIQNRSLFYKMKADMSTNISGAELRDSLSRYAVALDELYVYVQQYDLFLHKYEDYMKDISSDFSDLVKGFGKSLSSSLKNYEELRILVNDKMVHIEEKLNKMLKMYMK